MNPVRKWLRECDFSASNLFLCAVVLGFTAYMILR